MAEEFFDNLMMTVTMFLAIIFTALFWRKETQQRYVSYVVKEFAETTSANGFISQEDYTALLSDIAKADGTLSVELNHEHLSYVPYYHCYEVNELEDYFIRRNIRKTKSCEDKELSDTIVTFNETISADMKLQKETNESLLAHRMLQQSSIENATLYHVTAMVPSQSVYTNEPLITLCMASEDGKNYFICADEVRIQQTGRTTVELTLHQKPLGVFVEAMVYPREWVCENNHQCENSVNRIQYEQTYGTQAPCPICATIPSCIESSCSILYMEMGKTLEESELSCTVTYMDGHTEEVFPGCEGWSDNYDCEFFGIQQVEVRYHQIVFDELIVISKDIMCTVCNQRIGIRSFQDTKNYPYCSQCLSTVPTFLGDCIWEKELTASDEICDLLNDDDYLMKKGDLLEIKVCTEDGYMLKKTIMIQSEKGKP